MDRLDRIDRAVEIHARLDRRMPRQRHERLVDAPQSLIEPQQQRRPEAGRQGTARKIHHLADRFQPEVVEGFMQIVVETKRGDGQGRQLGSEIFLWDDFSVLAERRERPSGAGRRRDGDGGAKPQAAQDVDDGADDITNPTEDAFTTREIQINRIFFRSPLPLRERVRMRGETFGFIERTLACEVCTLTSHPRPLPQGERE